MKKAHLHSEQFDGALHTVCGRADDETARILPDDDFDALPSAERCAYCTDYMWPYGKPGDA